MSIDMKKRFDEELSKIRVNAAKNSVFLTETTYQKLVNDVQKAKTATKKEPRDYWLLNRYDVLTVENKSKLIYPVKKGASTIQFYVTDSELFHVLQEAHVAIAHGGRDKMMKELSTKYKNVTRHDIELYIHLCEPCRNKQKGIKKRIVVKPSFPELNSRCQVDLIDLQSQPDGEYKFIMVYQDHPTKFVILKSLKSKRAEEVAYNLVDIFSMLGAPCILQSNNGREFSSDVVTSLKEFWPALKIVHGKPRHSQISDKVNQDVENMVYAWMQDKKSDRWSEGLRFVQFMKNRACHTGIKRTPHEALFGCKTGTGVGLTTSFLPEDVLKDIHTEEQLEKVIESVRTMENGEALIRQEESVLKNMDEIIVDSGLNQHDEDEDMLNEEISVSDMCCVYLRETSEGVL